MDSAKDKLENMFDWDSKIKKNKATWQDYFDTLDDGEDYIKDLIKNTEDLSKVTGEDLTKACNSARQSILDHNAALQQQTIGAKAAAVGMNLLKTALNSIAYMAIIQAVISFANTIITKFDDIVNAYQNGIDKLKD